MLRHMIRLSVLIVALSSFAGIATTAGCAQEQRFAVKGVVVDQSGAVISQAEVMFKGESGTVISHTGMDGSVDVNLEPGKYLVTISAHAFVTTRLVDFLVPRPTADAFRVSLRIEPDPLERNDQYHEGLGVPTVVSDLPNVIKNEPPPDSSAVSRSVPAKRRSTRCLYLWRCSRSQP